jgi:hypothetical protein
MSSPISSAPYFDDYDPTKDFAAVLFRPGFSVQARELNQLQTLLQQQISRLGDNILKQGTIVSGCHLNHLPNTPYVKIKDLSTSGKAVDPTSFAGQQIKSSNGLNAVIIKGVNGFEAKAPDLNTLYVRYTNSGSNANTSTFTADQVLTVFEPTYGIDNVKITVGSSGFANTDSLYFMPAIEVTNTSGGNTFSQGLFVNDRLFDGSGANVAIESIAYNGSQTTIRLKPLVPDQNVANTAAWNVQSSSTIQNANTAQQLIC